MTRAVLVLPGLVACTAVRPGVAVPPCASIPVAPTDQVAIAPAPAPASAPASVCPADMVALSTFCIDRYEAPNVRGEVPFALQTAQDGEAWCSARGKRLCYQHEWVRACGGPRGTRYPYGDQHRESVCNDDRTWNTVSWKALAKWPADAATNEATRLLRADMSGARAECVSEEGVYDLTGNVAEWVRRSGAAPRPGYEYVLKGCYWAGCYKDPNPSCAFTNTAHPGSFRTYEAGFRCCSDRVEEREHGVGARPE
ncbi:MAG: SUMF1/EgtB/PvdO family nonheme iron enzyme [Polyangiaceae bacterium]